ncbi:hypothetical protein DFJ73DRAFT_764104 [Zopfochytrium polystomum]|nr:hypothetical protein DFJ73DRAFT_764104 [Zopfochytrium polystomum]
MDTALLRVSSPPPPPPPKAPLLPEPSLVSSPSSSTDSPCAASFTRTSAATTTTTTDLPPPPAPIFGVAGGGSALCLSCNGSGYLSAGDRPCFQCPGPSLFAGVGRTDRGGDAVEGDGDVTAVAAALAGLQANPSVRRKKRGGPRLRSASLQTYILSPSAAAAAADAAVALQASSLQPLNSRIPSSSPPPLPLLLKCESYSPSGPQQQTPPPGLVSEVLGGAATSVPPHAVAVSVGRTQTSETVMPQTCAVKAQFDISTKGRLRSDLASPQELRTVSKRPERGRRHSTPLFFSPTLLLDAPDRGAEGDDELEDEDADVNSTALSSRSARLFSAPSLRDLPNRHRRQSTRQLRTPPSIAEVPVPAAPPASSLRFDLASPARPLAGLVAHTRRHSDSQFFVTSTL